MMYFFVVLFLFIPAMAFALPQSFDSGITIEPTKKYTIPPNAKIGTAAGEGNFFYWCRHQTVEVLYRCTVFSVDGYVVQDGIYALNSVDKNEAVSEKIRSDFDSGSFAYDSGNIQAIYLDNLPEYVFTAQGRVNAYLRGGRMLTFDFINGKIKRQSF